MEVLTVKCHGPLVFVSANYFPGRPTDSRQTLPLLSFHGFYPAHTNWGLGTFFDLNYYLTELLCAIKVLLIMSLTYVIVGLNHGTRPRITMYSADYRETLNSDVMISPSVAKNRQSRNPVGACQ